VAKCDEGYLCEVCGEEVEGIVESDLYLRFVIGEMDPERLHTSAERHIVCNPVLAQFITDDRFEQPADAKSEIPAGFSLAELDAEYVATRRELVTRGYQRLHELAGCDESLAIHQYPLPEAAKKWKA